MANGRRKEIKHHLSEERIDELLHEAEDVHRLRRLGFVKNLYQGDTIPEAADREGRSAATGDRWAESWNEGGLEALMPSFGGGRPPKLAEDEREELTDRLRDGQPWTSREIQRLLDEEFDVQYHPDYLGTVLRDLGLSYVKSGSTRSSRPKETDDEEGWVVDDACTDGGVALDR